MILPGALIQTPAPASLFLSVAIEANQVEAGNLRCGIGQAIAAIARAGVFLYPKRYQNA